MKLLEKVNRNRLDKEILEEVERAGFEYKVCKDTWHRQRVTDNLLKYLQHWTSEELFDDYILVYRQERGDE